MPVNDVLGLTVDVVANTDNFVRAIESAARRSKIDFKVAERMVEKFKGAQSDIKGMFAKTIAEGATAGLGKVRLDSFVGKLQPLTDNIEKSMQRIFKMEAAVLKEGLTDSKKARLTLLMEEEKTKLAGMHLRFKQERLEADKLIKRRLAAQDEANRLAARHWSEIGEDFGDSIDKAFGDIKSGNLAGLMKGGGKRMGAWGAGLQERSAAGKGIPGMGGMGAGMLGGIGKILTTMGPALLAIGALVAGIAAIGKMFIDADAQAKTLNRTILDGGIAVGELRDEFGEASTTLDRLQRTFVNAGGAFDFNRLWGTTGKDHLEMLGAYAKAGVTFKELKNSVRDASDEMDRLRTVTAATLTYAKLLGTTNIEMAEIFASKMEELGTDIDGVQKSLSAVHEAAMASGFGVKRFFNMVLQATTGMSMYNVRMSEAAGLLTRLGKILGAAKGGDFLQSLTKGFGDESLQDRFKRVKTTGEGRTKDIFEKSAANTAQEFLNRVQSTGQAGALQQAMDGAGIKLDLSSQEGLVDSLGNLGQKDQTKMLAAARLSGNADLARQLTNLTQVVQGAKGGAQGMTMGMGGLDMGGKLAMKLSQGMAVFGKPLHEMNMIETMGFEQMFGVSGEQLEELRRVSQGMYGNWEMLKSMGKEAAAGKKFTERERQQQIKEFGAYVEDNGMVYSAKLDETTGEIIKGSEEPLNDINSYLQSQGDAFTKVVEAGISADTKLAQEQVAATTEMTKVLEQGIEWLLGEINDAVQSLASWFVGGLDGDEQAAKVELVQDLTNDLMAIREKERKAARDVSHAATPEAKAEAQGRLDSVRNEKAQKKATLTQARALKKGFGWFGSYSKDEMLEKVLGKVGGKERLDALGESGVSEDYIAQRKSEMQAAADKVMQDAMVKYGAATQDELPAKIAATKTRMKGGSIRDGTNYDLSPEDQAAQVMEGLRRDAAAASDEASKGSSGGLDMDALPDWMKENPWVQYIAQQRKKGPASVAGIAAEANAKAMIKPNTDQAKLIAQLLTEKEIHGKLQSALSKAGVGISEASDPQVSRWAQALSEGKEAPKDLRDLLGRKGQDDKTLQQFLEDANVPLGRGVQNDFIMQIGDDGRIKYAQGISSDDTTTAVSSKAGGPIDGMLRGGKGGGGVTIIQHNYSDMESIKKGYRSLMAARALG